MNVNDDDDDDYDGEEAGWTINHNGPACVASQIMVRGALKCE